MAKRKRSYRMSLVTGLGDGVGSLVGLVAKQGRMFGHAGGVLAVAIGLWTGLDRLEKHVRSLLEYQLPVQIQIESIPGWLGDQQVSGILAGLPARNVLDDYVVGEVADHIMRSGWVARVERVRKLSGGVVRVECDFREPFAVVQQDSSFYLVDEDGVRLPGVYSAAGSYLIIQGVDGPAPAPGTAWEADDLRAGLRLVYLVRRESFADQIGSVQVHNFRGRHSPSETHLTLLTRPGGSRGGWGRVLWGSSPGEEIEEPTAAEKIRLLRANYLQCGRVDAGAPWIDVSIRSGEYRMAAGEGTGVS